MRAEEQVGAGFSLERYLQARELTRLMVDEIGHQLVEGMSEADAHELAQHIFQHHGIKKLWHPTKIRFGINTLCTFKEESHPDVKLALGDLFYVDIGPVIDGHEGDYGDTFRCGGGSDPLITASRDLFSFTQKTWREQRLSGQALYQVASQAAQVQGLLLDARSAGHRCGDFPHALFHKGKLAEYATSPVTDLWVLEIHLVDVTRGQGAFFEDILRA